MQVIPPDYSEGYSCPCPRHEGITGGTVGSNTIVHVMHSSTNHNTTILTAFNFSKYNFTIVFVQRTYNNEIYFAHCYISLLLLFWR